MKLIAYMMKKFLSIFIGAFLFFVMILELVSLFMNLWNYLSMGVPVIQILKVLWYYMPRCAWYSIPMSMLFAAVYMLSDLYAKNELLAIFASGISLFRFTFPLLILSVIMSFGLFFLEDNIVVKSDAKYNALQASLLNREKSLNNDDVVIISDEGKIIYKTAFYDAELMRLYNTYIIFRNEDKTLDRITYADNAVWAEDHWELSGIRTYIKLPEGYVSLPSLDDEHLMRLSESPATFQNNTVDVTQVSSREAKEYIEHLERAGLPTAEPKSEYYKKFAFPAVVFIVVFLAIGLSGKTRKNVLLISLALSIVAVVLFYVTQMVTMLMAKFGAIPPVMGEWFPVMLFTIISIILLRYART